MSTSRSLTDILGNVDGDYRNWLVRSARRYVTKDIPNKTDEWTKVSKMTNKYTGYVSVTQKDISGWVNETNDLVAIILALCTEVRDLENTVKRIEEKRNGENKKEEKPFDNTHGM